MIRMLILMLHVQVPERLSLFIEISLDLLGLFAVDFFQLSSGAVPKQSIWTEEIGDFLQHLFLACIVSVCLIFS